ncbi:hypothetical protein BHM03_00055343 [Ensete ventricosum]|nr:hypothetical protein BHM03_00055343 [Ensete ventricosum]
MREVEFPSVFHAPSRKFKILAIPNVYAHGKSYKHGFVKKCDVINFTQRRMQSGFRSVFRAPSKKFIILAILNVLAHEKSYEHGFMKKCNVRSVFRAPSQKFKILAIPNDYPMGGRTIMVS